jgi:acetyltransferase-like isoleucine patch superfamily enzyme
VNDIALNPACLRDAASSPSFSVIIPAHNEEAVISRCIENLLADAMPGEIEIVVAANGCTDRTVQIARGFGPVVRVVEVAEASKSGALNAGDAAATVFPRVYLDADIAVSAAALRATVAEMALDGALAGAPNPILDLRGCSAAVRSFCRVWTALPWFTQRPVGSGLYILSASGHTRLGRFPDIINDDQYVHNLFGFDERLAIDKHSFTLRPPRTVAALVRRRARTMAGQSELDAKFGALKGRAPKMTLLRMLYARPDLVPHLPAFALVTFLAKRAAKANARRGERNWGRDDTSRAAARESPTAKGASDKTMNGVRSLLDPMTWIHGLRLLHYYSYTHVREKRRLRIGSQVQFAPNVSIANGERIAIGDRCHVGERVCLWAGDSTGRITLGDDVMIGPAAILTASDYGLVEGTPPAFQTKRERDIVVRDGVWIGANVVVTAGVTIGEGCIVGAGSVVTRDLPPNTVCAGVPAKARRPRPKAQEQSR